MTIDELRRLMNQDREPLPDSSTIVPFGKYKGQPIERLLDNVQYCGWMCKQEGMVDELCKRHPMFGAVLTDAIGTGAPALSKQEKAERRVEMKIKAEKQRAELAAKRAAKQTERERAPAIGAGTALALSDSAGLMTYIGERISRVSAADLDGATAGQKFMLELVTEAHKRSVQILGSLPGDADQTLLNEARASIRAIWEDLPAPSQWWLGTDPVPPARRKTPAPRSLQDLIISSKRKP